MAKILEIKRSNKKGIIEYKATIKAVKSGNGAAIYLPKQLLGKEIEVQYKKRLGRKNENTI